MPKHSKPRAGSLQFWPHKKARKFLPSVNWKAIKSDSSLLGFIAYKAGMSSCIVKNLTENALNKDKRIPIPVTILEVPPMKIFSVRFYKEGKVTEEILAENLEKELKRKVKLPKKKKTSEKIDNIKDYDDVRIIVYSLVKKTGIKKKPDLAEVALGGNLEEKIKFIKENLNKEISASEILKTDLVDVRGLTKGKGIQGPVKRFGIKLKQYKSEKGRRRPGSIGPWHPAHVTFRVPMAGQLGLFSRIKYNNKVISIGKVTEDEKINPKSGWKNYGKIKTEYIIVEGSVQGPAKRQLLLTLPLRPTKKQLKKKYEFLKLR